jgi:DNA-binding transcriptional MerR regulator
MTDTSATTTTPDLLTITEVAEMLRKPVATLRYWRHLGTGPRSFLVGRGVRYFCHEVLDWLQQQSNADRGPTAA